MKKICMIIQHHFDPPHCRTYDKAKVLSENGYDVTTICLWKKNLAKKEKLDYSTVLRVSDRGIAQPKLPILNNPQLVYRFYKKALQTKADVYHVCDMDSILVGFLLKTLAKKRVIYDIGDDFPSYNNYPHAIQSIIRSMEGHLSKPYDAMIVLSNSLKKDRMKYHKDIHVIYYAPDPSFNPENVIKDSKGTDFTLVFEGQITSKKGVIEIIEALFLILGEIKSTKLLLIGEIREEIEKRKIMSLIDNNNLKEHVEITGWMKHTEIPKFINQGDVGLIIFKPWSYSYITGVPNKLIDYMACAKPVVTSKDFPEIERIVNDSKGGILVDHDDPKQIAQAVIKLLKDDDLRMKMGQNARNYIEKNHNWKSFEKRLLDIYHDLGS